MNRPFSAPRSAFSLIEVSIALVIFVIGAVALLRIFPPGLGVIESSGNRRTGYKLAQNLLTRYEKNPASSEAFLDAPDAIYDAQRVGSNWQWSDVRGSMISRERGRVSDANIGTAELPGLPRSPDDFRLSMLDRARYISGERQRVTKTGPLEGTVALNFIPEGARASVFREGLVRNIAISPNGQLDFNNATYVSSYHGVGDNQPFRQAIIEAEGATSEVTLDENTDTSVTLQLDFLNRAGYMAGALNGVSCDVEAVFDPSGQADASDVVFPPQNVVFAPNGTATLNITITDNIEENDEFFRFRLSNAVGASIRDPYIRVRILANDDDSNPSTNPTPAGSQTATPANEILPVRAPNELRANTTFYVSYKFDGGGVRSQPMTFPLNDAAYPQTGGGIVPHVGSQTNFAPFETEFFTRFRTFLGTASPDPSTSGNRNGIDVSALDVPEMGYLAPPSPPPAPPTSIPFLQATALDHVALDYNVYDWRFISEYIPNFTTPYPANTATFPTVADENSSEDAFLGAIFDLGTYQNARETRTSIGNLYGPVYRTLKAPSGETRIYPALDARTVTVAPGTPAVNKKARQYLKASVREGRLLFDGDDFSTADRAIINYRSNDDWVQQLSVTAHHYLPFAPGLAAPREPWREYARIGNKLYFRASEAGKRISVLRNANPGYETFTIGDKLENVPAAISAFSTAVAGEAVGGKVAVCDLESPTTAVFDVAAPDIVDGTDSSRREVLLNPRGTTGMMGRVAWLFNGNYEQEILR